ncbi:esterase-like activity of phytase family protein [Psychrobacter sanguinis]|uniref:esterase-like activity of phytase family protein n=1 Tax=Psychrobacter sanguinis TaxID=861445 RepID=UPI002A75992E|nr:esterase-like activity of phytase family protein [Psychrobacter sanguinis]MDY3305925.1 esterase-like activity of phytase family protein [Psychrobacter sanguinis]
MTSIPTNFNSPLSNDLNPITQGTALPYDILNEQFQNAAYPETKLQIRGGGFGSDAAAHPTNPNQFYALTDRGPNSDFKGSLGEGKQFLVPDYSPKIGLFEVEADGQIHKIKEIVLKDRNGQPVSGLPNPKALGGTNEIPYDISGNPMTIDPSKPYDPETNPVKTDLNGLDPEGLAALEDGSFWISDEYGPHLVHYDAQGIEIERINPFTQDSRNNVIIEGRPLLLPAEFAKRRTNRGMESLTITPDQSTLVGVMESSMDNPDNSGRLSTLTRMVMINLKNGVIKQYLCRLDAKEHVNSAIAALSEHEFYVAEHDRQFPLQQSTAKKLIYKFDISQATDINNLQALSDNSNDERIRCDSELGLLINGQTLEQWIAQDECHWDTLAELGIHPVQKTLAVDILQAIDYPHDKLEGIWLRQDGSIGLLNDDDFAMNDSDKGVEHKYLDAEKTIIDGNRLYVVYPKV